MNSEYLGKWYKETTKDNEINEINVVQVIGTTAITEDGVRISLQELDHSGLYEKLHPYAGIDMSAIAQFSSPTAPPINNKPISNDTKSNDPLGIPSKLHTVPQVNDYNKNVLPNGIITFDNSNRQLEFNDPISTMIGSIIQIHKSKGIKSEFPITIQLKFDFDILTVVKLAMESGASDIEIISNVIKYLPINVDDVKKSIVLEMLSPEDAELVLDNREDTFNETLLEELNREDNTEK